MGRPRMRADFFVDLNGNITSKAKQLNYNQRKIIFDRDKEKCLICGCPVLLLGGTYDTPFRNKFASAIDHIFPRARGGQNNLENLRLLCRTCNAKRNGKYGIPKS